ncbi:MAG TPA: Rrf2 family transcriptional regulator [Polyangium sp.]|nr:Rrf2 family transcriptional regulator [Polyangium sp.]
MKLSNKGRYGVRALFDIAFHNEGRATQIREIADRETIPVRFLEQIFQDLKKAGIIGAKRGPRGGYHLARPAAEISLGDVFRALEGPIVMSSSEEESREERVDPDAPAAIFKELAGSIESCFDSISIADICEKGTALGLRPRGRERAVYVI